MDTGVPSGHLTAAAWRHLNWRTGQPRFRVVGEGAEAMITMFNTSRRWRACSSCRISSSPAHS
eukprot:9293056-Alexandrium_andersonii.AAC.1